MDKESIILGSGDLYLLSHTKGQPLPTNAEIETDDNRFCYVSGGASVEYKPEYYTAEDDMGYVKKTRLIKEDVTLKTGLGTWCGNVLEKLGDTVTVTEAANMRTVKIGGAGKQKGALYVIHFVHKDAQDGDVRVTIVGVNQAGFTIAFAKDKESIIDAEFKAMPIDDTGTLLNYQEEIIPGGDTEGG